MNDWRNEISLIFSMAIWLTTIGLPINMIQNNKYFTFPKKTFHKEYFESKTNQSETITYSCVARLFCVMNKERDIFVFSALVSRTIDSVKCNDK